MEGGGLLEQLHRSTPATPHTALLAAESLGLMLQRDKEDKGGPRVPCEQHVKIYGPFCVARRKKSR